MDCIDLKTEAKLARDEIDALATVQEETVYAWTQTDGYHAWRAYLADIANSECGPIARREMSEPSISSRLGAEVLALDGVPRERIIGMFILLFT